MKPSLSFFILSLSFLVGNDTYALLKHSDTEFKANGLTSSTVYSHDTWEPSTELFSSLGHTTAETPSVFFGRPAFPFSVPNAATAPQRPSPSSQSRGDVVYRRGPTIVESTLPPSPGPASAVKYADVLTEELSYDGRGRLVSEQVTLSSGGATHGVAVSRSYDELGRPAGSVTVPLGGGSTFQGLAAAVSFDIRGRVRSRSASRGGSPFYSELLLYDEPMTLSGAAPSYAGLITEKVQTWSAPGQAGQSSVEGYSHDSAGRVTGAFNQQEGTHFSYDARGNVTRTESYTTGDGGGLALRALPGRTVTGTETFSYSGDMAVSLVKTGTGAGTSAFSYDGFGRMTLDGTAGTALSYNHLDLPARVSSQSGATLADYSYLADGMKTEATDGNGQGLAYRGAFTCGVGPSGALTLESASFTGGRLLPSGVRLHVTDHLGSVVAVVDGDTGDVYRTDSYSVYGERGSTRFPASAMGQAPSGEKFREGFTGKEDQEQDFGLPYTDYGARIYSPMMKRWTVPDPLGEKYYDVSPYAYCAGNPVDLVDPDGKDIWRFDNMGRLLDPEPIHDETIDKLVVMIQNTDGTYRENEDSIVILPYRTITSIEYDDVILSIEGKDNAKKVFEQMANHTNVEWSFVSYLNSSSAEIGNSHSRTSNRTILNSIKGKEDILETVIHSHPIEPYPSTKDKLLYEQVLNNSHGCIPVFQIYHILSGYYIQYDSKGPIYDQSFYEF